MKTSIQRQEWSRRPGQWGSIERSCNCVKICVPNIASFKSPGLYTFQGRPAHVLAKSRKHIGVSKVACTRVPLPPIDRSRSVSRNVAECLTTKSMFRPGAIVLKEHSTNSTMMDKAPPNASHRKTCRRNSNEKISVRHQAENKAGIQAPMNHGGLIKRPFDAQSAVTLTLEPLERQRKDDANQAGADANGTAMPDRVTHDASLHPAEQQRGFCSSESAIETESEDKSGSDSGQKEASDDYYTEERIAEWVLSVNSCLFKTGNDEDEGQREPAEEQDVATIKIVYDGEKDV